MDCQVCGKAGDLPCPGCGALFYCGRKHMSRHRRFWHCDEECSRMRRQMEAGAAMEAMLPFSYSHNKGSSNKGSMAKSGGDSSPSGSSWRCQLLKHAGLHGLGMWRRECACWMEEPWGSLTDQGGASACCPCDVDSDGEHRPPGRPEPADAGPKPAGGTEAPGNCEVPNSTSEDAPGYSSWPWEGGQAWEELCQRSQQLPLPSTTRSHLCGWSVFCSACCLSEPETSPLPLLLSAPLTLAAAISRRKVQHHSEGGDSPLKARSSSSSPCESPFVVHWLGPQKELDQIPAIATAAAGIGHETPLVVRLVGPDMPPSWEGRCWDVPNPFAAGRGLRGVQIHSRLCPSTPPPPMKPGCVRVTSHPGAYHERFSCRWTHCQTSSSAASPEPGNAVDDARGHQKVVEDELPDLVFAPNAGVPAYSSWAASLEALTSPGAPACLFTDYTEEAASMASAAVIHASDKHERCTDMATGDSNVLSISCPEAQDTHHLRIVVKENPFLCSTTTPSGTALPAYSNGWLIGWNGALE